MFKKDSKGGFLLKTPGKSENITNPANHPIVWKKVRGNKTTVPDLSQMKIHSRINSGLFSVFRCKEMTVQNFQPGG